MLENYHFKRSPDFIKSKFKHHKFLACKNTSINCRFGRGSQSYLVQMLYVLFAKPHDAQIVIFSTLQAYLMQSEQSEDV